MPVIPMNQSCFILKHSPDATDGWGNKIEQPPITLKCRFVEGSKLYSSTTALSDVRDMRGREIVASGTFYFDKYAPVTLHDRIEYTDEFGVTTTYRPLNIVVKRSVGGKALATVVIVG